ncbi:hypothetical protein GGP41_007829 [Bipolaris sorokiniana]|uniref:Uncharacterized protein n=1 Tax=Cochliobolus sativus TaxID=45130 RepID=A0A8H5ZRA5_COCSA|nr:hypothetical protein GGP41_007829 [Bipolaris sorokiniana]
MAPSPCNGMISATNLVAETGQEEDPAELVESRNTALATQGLSTSCTPTNGLELSFWRHESFLC